MHLFTYEASARGMAESVKLTTQIPQRSTSRRNLRLAMSGMQRQCFKRLIERADATVCSTLRPSGSAPALERPLRAVGDAHVESWILAHCHGVAAGALHSRTQSVEQALAQMLEIG